MNSIKRWLSVAGFIASISILSACSSTTSNSKRVGTGHYSDLSDPIMVIDRLDAQQQQWKGTGYKLGGNTKSGIDCSGFMQVTFKDLFGIKLPRTTNEQAKSGKQIAKSELRPGDLVFFKTGRGPNGKHVGVYVKNGQFLHASTKGGVIYSALNSPYWSKAFWQARRL